MSNEEPLVYVGAAAYFLPPLITLIGAARLRRRSPAIALFALLGWVGMAIGLAVLFAQPPGPPRPGSTP